MRSNKTIYVLALGIFGIATTEFGVIGILPMISDKFNVSIESAGWLLSSFAIIVALFAPFMMVLLSAYNRKKLLMITLLVFAISNMLSVVAFNFTFLLIARMLPAFFHPVYWAIGLSASASLVDKQDAPKAASIIFGGFTIASIIGVPLAALMADIFDWRYSFILSAVINIISLLGLILYLPQIPVQRLSKENNSYAVLKNKTLWINLSLSFLLITAMYTTYGYMAEYLKRITKMNGKEISMMLLLFGVAGVFGNRLAGKYLSINLNKTILWFILLLMLTHGLLFSFGIYFWLMVIIIALWGLVHTGGFVISNVNVISTSNDNHEFLNSIFTSCGNAAVTVGAVFGGQWIAAYGVHSIAWASIACLLLASVVLIVKEKIIAVNNNNYC